MKPTIVLVRGTFAESGSWNSVIDSLADAGYPVIAAGNPLRSVATDATSVGDLVRTIDGPVVLVAHSYGGAVISFAPSSSASWRSADARRTVEIPGASHGLAVSQPQPAVNLILEAAASRVAV